MKGIEFQSIRRANKLSAHLFTSKFGVGRQLFSNVENSEYVPIQYIVYLSELIRTDITKKANFDIVFSEIPDKFKKPMRKNMGYFNSLEHEQLK